MKQSPNYKPINYKSNYCDFLIENGFILNKYNTDFYSDGLRFATFTEYS
jgi:hypothetical protein